MASPKDVLKQIADNEVKFVDFRFTDTRGSEQHVSVPASAFDEDKSRKAGKMFDGSSIAGWKGIEASDMLLMPDDSTAVLDPFTEEPTLILVCDIIEPSTMQGYERDPRSLAKRAEAYLKSSGIGDTAFFGPEPEFFIFDGVSWNTDMSGSFVKIESEEASWNTDARNSSPATTATVPRVKGGYFPVPPVDHDQDMRSDMCNCSWNRWACRSKCTTTKWPPPARWRSARSSAPWCNAPTGRQILKYIVHNVAHAYGKTATFMPKPLVGDNGSGMHVHQSIWKDGKNLFAGDGYAGLSEFALYYIGGIIKHARALNAFTNPGTNSYKRLVPGFEAPVMLAYSARNRSASIRIPYVSNPKARRIEARFPDPSQPLPGLLRAADGRPGRHPEQDPPRRCRRQEPVRPAAGRRREGNPDRLRHAGTGAGRAGQGPRVPDQGRRVHRRLHRCLHRAEDGRSEPSAHDHAPGRIRHVLQPLIPGAVAGGAR